MPPKNDTTTEPNTPSPKPDEVDADAADSAASDELDTIAAEHGGDEPAASSDRLPAETQGASADDCRDTAELYVAGSLWMIGQQVGIHYSEKTVSEGADALAPVLAKHGGELPPWLMRWREELEFARWAGTVAFQTYRTIKHAQAQEQADAERARAEQSEGPQGQGGAASIDDDNRDG